MTFRFVELFNDALLKINETTKIKNSEQVFNMVKNARDDYHSKVLTNVQIFCEGQRSKIAKRIKEGKIFNDNQQKFSIASAITDMVEDVRSVVRQESYEDTNTLLGYLNCMFRFFSLNLDKTSSPFYIHLDQEYFYKRFEMQIKDMLIDILDEEMLKNVDDAMHGKKKKDLELLQEALDHTISWQRKVSLKKTESLSHAREGLCLKQIKTEDLILQFLQKLNLSSEEVRGKIVLSAWNYNQQLLVSIREITGLVLKPGKSSIDFSFSIVVAPNIKEKHKSKIYTNKTEINLEAETNLKVYTFSETNAKNILQVVLYEHNMLRTKKSFRGIYQLPLDGVKADVTKNKADVFTGEFRAYPSILNSYPNHPNLPLWNELSSRVDTDNVAQKFILNGTSYMFGSKKSDFRV